MWHRLDDHLRGAAALARGFGAPFGCGDLTGWAALVHDAGKASMEWQTRLAVVASTGAAVGVDHKSFGVQLARRHGLSPVEWAVAGHHGGLTRRGEIEDLFGEDDEAQLALEKCWAEVEQRLRGTVPEIFSAVPTMPGTFQAADATACEFLVRFVFSCLVDADALDTRAHRLAEPVRPSLPLAADQLLERFLARRAAYLSRRSRSLIDESPGPMDELRETVFSDALRAAESPPGLFRLTAPTGAAKTLAAAGFALRHAAVHGKSRVIVAVPFITITEQNAQVYRHLLDDEADPVVLEHHSGVADASEAARLAAENWDAPFVVTTTVQLLESLFGRRPSQMRKVHRLANSVIVLDEVQALPHRLLPQIADALRILATYFNVTVLLSSATQPELWTLGPLRDLRAREVVADPAAAFAGARRVRYRWMTDPRPDLGTVVRDAGGHERVLMVVNTVRDARRAYRLALDSVAEGVMVRHLSTGMCAAHRRRVLVEVREALAAQHRVFLVSTSLIEAGVDLDFPVVYRAVAPPESVAQAAGRCNREGRLGAEGGLVVVFDPVDGGAPPMYRTQVGKSRQYFGPNQADPDDIVALARYFPDLYRTLGIEDRTGVAAEIARNRRRWDFRAVADGPLLRGDSTARNRSRAFRLIDEDTVTVVAPYGDADRLRQVDMWLDALRGGDLDPRLLRWLQPQLTTIRRKTTEKASVRARLDPVVGDLFAWRGTYDDGFGLVLEPDGEDIIL